jgi:chorismate mutase/prephenate dehydratase
MSQSLDALRHRLDQVDRRLIEALSERQRLVTEVAAVKADPSLPLQDGERERELLARITAHAQTAGLDSFFVESLYRRILDHSIRFQAARQSPGDRASGAVVAFQGIEGSYSHTAARSHFAAANEAVQFHGYRSFAAAIDALTRNEADIALLPIENSLTGSITETYDLLSRANLHIIGEEVLRVEHCLLALKPVPLGLIRRIGSHPQALAQCGSFLQSLDDCRVEIEEDTASAAMLVAESGDLSRGAIASEEAGRRYGLQVIKRHVANQKENFTRFVAIARDPVTADPRLPHKTSLLLTTAHEQGALARCLDTLAQHGVNLTKLESRPSNERPWQYLFYLDHEGGLHEENVERALAEVRKIAQAVRVLGSYPRAGATTPAPQGAAPSKSPAEIKRRTGDRLSLTSPAPQNGSYRLASRANRIEDSVVEIGSVRVGGDAPFAIIAGPCSVESRAQITECARAVQEAGVKILRGGCFKPRTSTYDFQGLGFDGLTLLHEAARAFGLSVVTEVLHPGDVDAVAREADVLQIGARNMQNFALL